MLKVIDPEVFLSELMTDCVKVPEEVVAALSNIVLEVNNGKKLITKLKTTKSATYINVYEYDKTSWRYLLVDSIEVPEI